MAACGSLQHRFEKSLPENPTLLESLSQWKNQIKPVKPLEQPSFTEIFGELHFKDTSSCLPSSSFPIPSFSTASSPFIDLNTQTVSANVNKGESDSSENKCENSKRRSIFDSFSSSPNSQYTASSHRSSDGFSPRHFESLQLCTEGLGFESSDDVEDMKSDIDKDWQYHEEKVSITKHSVPEDATGEFRRSRSSGGEFPPPISCIGKSGKPWVCFKSYRHDGRFVLKEVRIPTFEFLHACREDGRLKLHFVHPNEETFDEVEEEEEDDGEENHTQYDEQEETEAKCNENNDSDNDGATESGKQQRQQLP